jgi:hypothetical protein
MSVVESLANQAVEFRDHLRYGAKRLKDTLIKVAQNILTDPKPNIWINIHNSGPISTTTLAELLLGKGFDPDDLEFQDERMQKLVLYAGLQHSGIPAGIINSDIPCHYTTLNSNTQSYKSTLPSRFQNTFLANLEIDVYTILEELFTSDTVPDHWRLPQQPDGIHLNQLQIQSLMVRLTNTDPRFTKNGLYMELRIGDNKEIETNWLWTRRTR